MRKSWMGFPILFMGCLVLSVNELPSTSVLNKEPDFGKIPLYFIPNRGQADQGALFYAKTSHYTLWLTTEGLIFDAPQKAGDYERDASRLLFVNADENLKVMPLEETEHRVNYFIGDDPEEWRTDIPTFRAVLYKSIYSNIDLKVYGLEKRIEYDWVLKPGGKPEDIRFRYDRMQATRIDKAGDLIIEGRYGRIRHRKPFGYQIIGGHKKEVDAGFKINGTDEYGFRVNDYDPGYDLIIDPVVLVYSTYLGGYKSEEGRGIAVDSGGSAYVTGYTGSLNFPVKNAYQGTSLGGDAFITKFSPSGKSLVYSTYLGGAGLDRAAAIVVDKTGAVYIAGNTRSNNFPTKNAYQKTLRGWTDIFVTKLSPGGTSLVYSTYLGGSDNDVESSDEDVNDIAVDANGAAYVTGSTTNTDFPVKNAYQKKHRGYYDVFVTKFSPSGSSLVYSTYLGGTEYDSGGSICVDSQRAAYITGSTESGDFPVKSAFQKTLCGYRDAFVTKLSPGGTRLVYSSYLGGSGYEESGNAISVDSRRAVFIAGHTNSTDFPVKNAYQGTYGGGSYDAFVANLSPSGAGLVYSTFLGGSADDYSRDMALDDRGAVSIVGSTSSTNFPVKNAYQSTYGGGWDDAFVARLAPAGTGLDYSTYLGGSDLDYGYGIAVDSGGSAYVTGMTRSLNFPLKNAFQKSLHDREDAFVTKISLTAKSGQRLAPPVANRIQ
ncbi:MAG: SBBP repeat-containing protein [Candidatus Aminicenantes bacterium]|nr:SBBP repeat-containing protein [Candidatus Aminicenantes bacterium]